MLEHHHHMDTIALPDRIRDLTGLQAGCGCIDLGAELGPGREFEDLAGVRLTGGQQRAGIL
jgi:hypothetical protein